MDKEIDFLEDAAPKLTNEGLSEVSGLAVKTVETLDKIESTKALLKQLEREHFELISNLLPAAMDNMHIRELTLDDGRHIEVKDDLAASISPKKKDEAYAWLRTNGHEDIIKNEIKTNLGRGSDEISGKVQKFLVGLEVPYKLSETVHAGTLKSFVKEQIADGNNIPHDLFGVFIYRTTKLTNKKGK